ncbi:DNA polymerase IV [Desulfofundulus thermosubterraneus]|uniref:DNA polymerase IV n=1 Tax=Desulfofundulus thermosubterraneus DSM 16057 TaxID=1121432 RepID=A0A1M6ESL1_9FIRM|nr:DNA polymerase IV [Desulfofundulus thermosubterraneus]SHI88514.1 DNA polymerase-4 [Desulfofundulus thermosubterraneus DSM 16057]
MSHDILLCDLDAFFASVEQRDHPEYRGRSVIVGGRPDERGVVATCSYEARKYGIRSAMPMSRAVKLCPNAVFLPVDMARYRRVSAQVFAVYARFAAQIEPVSIDEAYLAVPSGRGMATARKIREAVRRELNLPVSIGVSVNKLLAKMACELAKPDSLKQIKPEDVPAVVWPLPVRKLHGVGPHTEERLHQIGVRTIGQLAAFLESELVRIFGSFGATLHQYANGIDTREIEQVRKIKSVGEETTFPRDVYDREAVLRTLLELAEQVGYRLRRKKLKGRTVTVKIRFSDFSTITRSRTLLNSVDEDGAIYKAARELFLDNCGRPPWRLVGIQVSNLEDGSYEQLSLFAERKKEKQLCFIIDELREKYGKDVIKKAALLNFSSF